MAPSIRPESGYSAGDTHRAVRGERGKVELDEPVGTRLVWEFDDGVLHVDFHGEVCAWSVERLQPVLMSLLADVQPWAIVADLSGVTFLDAAGVQLLIRVRQLVTDRCAELTLESPSAFVRRVLELCELDREFEFR